jgi:hypothetical protein
VGGVHGGTIVAEGTPEKVAKTEASSHGECLPRSLSKDSPQLEWKEISFRKKKIDFLFKKKSALLFANE